MHKLVYLSKHFSFCHIVTSRAHRFICFIHINNCVVCFLSYETHNFVKHKNSHIQPGGGNTHAFNSSPQKAVRGGSLNSRPACSTEQVPGQPGLLTHRHTQTPTAVLKKPENKQTNKQTKTQNKNQTRYSPAKKKKKYLKHTQNP